MPKNASIETLPLFPLPNVVLLPAGVIPLHVFESRYCNLVRSVQERNQLLAIPQLAPGWEATYHAEPPIHPVFGLGRIIECEPLEDDRFNILVEGLARVQLLSEDLHIDGFREAHVTLLEDEPGDLSSLDKNRDKIRMALGQLLALHPHFRPLGRLMNLDMEDAVFADTLSHALMTDPAARQKYIESNEVSVRMHLTRECVEHRLAEFLSQ